MILHIKTQQFVTIDFKNNIMCRTYKTTYLWTLLQHLIFKSKESFLDFGISQRKWQEVRERLLPTETVEEDLNSSDGRWNGSFVGACDNCEKMEASWEKVNLFQDVSSHLFSSVLWWFD